MIMVKPAMTYLDLIRQAREPLSPRRSRLPGLSGEFSNDRPPRRRTVFFFFFSFFFFFFFGAQIATAPCSSRSPSIRRAGADFALTYFAMEAARLLDSCDSTS